jgi:hypothetical protein
MKIERARLAPASIRVPRVIGSIRNTCWHLSAHGRGGGGAVGSGGLVGGGRGGGVIVVVMHGGGPEGGGERHYRHLQRGLAADARVQLRRHRHHALQRGTRLREHAGNMQGTYRERLRSTLQRETHAESLSSPRAAKGNQSEGTCGEHVWPFREYFRPVREHVGLFWEHLESIKRTFWSLRKHLGNIYSVRGAFWVRSGSALQRETQLKVRETIYSVLVLRIKNEIKRKNTNNTTYLLIILRVLIIY